MLIQEKSRYFLVIKISVKQRVRVHVRVRYACVFFERRVQLIRGETEKERLIKHSKHPNIIMWFNFMRLLFLSPHFLDIFRSDLQRCSNPSEPRNAVKM